jgi:hypothetical protein
MHSSEDTNPSALAKQYGKDGYNKMTKNERNLYFYVILGFSNTLSHLIDGNVLVSRD